MILIMGATDLRLRAEAIVAFRDERERTSWLSGPRRDDKGGTVF